MRSEFYKFEYKIKRCIKTRQLTGGFSFDALESKTFGKFKGSAQEVGGKSAFPESRSGPFRSGLWNVFQQ